MPLKLPLRWLMSIRSSSWRWSSMRVTSDARLSVLTEKIMGSRKCALVIAPLAGGNCRVQSAKPKSEGFKSQATTLGSSAAPFDS